MKHTLSGFVRLGMATFLLVVGLAAPSQAAHAVAGATITVTSNSDANSAVDGVCTLREAMMSAITNANYHECVNSGGAYGDDYVQFSVAGSTTITLGSDLPTLSSGVLTMSGDNLGRPIVLDGANARTVLYVGGSATLTLADITVQHGAASGGLGGGAFNQGVLIVMRSTFRDNTASAEGGAIENSGSLNVSNSTFTGNSSNYGGAISNNSASAYIRNSTFSGNTAWSHGGALSTYKGGTPVPVTEIYNTIMANSSAPEDCYRFGGTGTMTGSNNIIETTAGGPPDCSAVTATTGDPALGALGGSPAYFPLMTGSPAIDQGDNTICANPPVNGVDERGITRPQGAHCDIGAYELIKSVVDVTIGASPMGTYDILQHAGTRDSYPGSNAGPVAIVGTSGTNIVASERFIYAQGTGSDHRSGTPTSYSEMMGFPANQLTTEYWFPWYNNVNMWSQLRFANASASLSTTVSVYLGTTLLGSYPLGPSASTRVDYPGVNGGPLRIVSSGGVPIIGAERIIYSDLNGSVQNGNHTSYYELMGFPGNHLTTEYWIPWYNNVNMWTQLRLANPSATLSTTISVYVGTTLLGSYPMGPGISQRVDYPTVSNGPLRIVSSGGVNIIAAERVIYSVGGVQNGTHTSYSELMAIPGDHLTSTYWFPSYSYPDSGTWSQVRFANPSETLSTTVEVYLGGVLKGTYPLGPRISTRVDYLGEDSGPLEVTTTDGRQITAAMRVIQSVSGTQTSYSEITGLPDNQLTTGYVFPWYNNNNFDTQLRLAVP